MSKPPLWMPEGSIRAVLALSIVGGATVASFTDPAAADTLLPLAGAVTVFYFKERSNGQ